MVMWVGNDILGGDCCLEESQQISSLWHMSDRLGDPAVGGWWEGQLEG